MEKSLMVGVDFSECKFINESMRFYTYNDFCKNRKSLKMLYKVLTQDGKIFYKWYVYANIHMNETFKNAIWDYLNGIDKDGSELMRLERLYHAR